MSKLKMTIGLLLAGMASAQAAVPDIQKYCPTYPNCPVPLPPQECTVATSLSLPCTAGMTGNSNHVSGTTVTPVLPTNLPAQGTTDASVNANFPTVINWEWTNLTALDLNIQFEQMTPVMLARFSHFYWITSGGNLSTLNGLAAAKLTAANYATYQRAFNPASTTAFPQSYAAHMRAGAKSSTMNGTPAGVAAPNPGMTLYEIFTEYLFTEAQTTTGAIALAGKYAFTQLSTAWTIGYSIGTGFYAIASYLDPSYGFDLVTTYGSEGDYGLPTGTVTVGDPVEIGSGSEFKLDDWQSDD